MGTLVKYRIYHISTDNRHNRTEYIRAVDSPKEAVFVLDVLAKYDLALEDTILWNIQGLQESEDGEIWEEWQDTCGDTIDSYDYEKVKAL